MLMTSGCVKIQADIAEKCFFDPTRDAKANSGPFIIVIDGFYDEPYVVRERALASRFHQYSPPTEGLDKFSAADRIAFARMTGRWLTTRLTRVAGKDIGQSTYGSPFRPRYLRAKLEQVLGRPIDPSTWNTAGDCWNGEFHLREAGHVDAAVHHHFKQGDLEKVGWSGIIHLSPKALADSGTLFWRDKATNRCIEAFGPHFYRDRNRFEIAAKVEHKFNRLVLFREHVLHSGEDGFGRGADARLFQTVFFEVGD